MGWEKGRRGTYLNTAFRSYFEIYQLYNASKLYRTYVRKEW